LGGVGAWNSQQITGSQYSPGGGVPGGTYGTGSKVASVFHGIGCGQHGGDAHGQFNR
jgi:hypothetical protein